MDEQAKKEAIAVLEHLYATFDNIIIDVNVRKYVGPAIRGLNRQIAILKSEVSAMTKKEQALADVTEGMTITESTFICITCCEFTIKVEDSNPKVFVPATQEPCIYEFCEVCKEETLFSTHL